MAVLASIAALKTAIQNGVKTNTNFETSSQDIQDNDIDIVDKSQKNPNYFSYLTPPYPFKISVSFLQPLHRMVV